VVIFQGAAVLAGCRDAAEQRPQMFRVMGVSSPKMKTWLKALFLGCTSEGGCLALLLGFGHVGPCGPSNLLGVLFFVYMMPTFYVCDVLHIEDPWSWIPAVILHTAFWSFVWYGVLKLRSA
jgi:hypothetical protein